VQTKQIKTLKVPEYFAEYRESGEGYASFLGASIVAKVRPLFPVLWSGGTEGNMLTAYEWIDHIQRSYGEELPEQSGLFGEGPSCNTGDVTFVVVDIFMNLYF
jgi:hypothetical protein